MKKISRTVFVIFISSLVVCSCINIPETVIPDNPLPSAINNVTPFFVASLNNSSWTATSPTGHYDSIDSTVTVSGSNSSGSISIVFNMKQSNNSIVSAQAVIGGTSYPYYIVTDFTVNSSLNQVSSAVSGTFDITFYNTTATTGTGVSFAMFNSGSFLVKPN